MAAAERAGGAAPRPLPAEDGILDEATRKDLFTDTCCKVCGAVLPDELQRTSHYQGKKHAKKLHRYLRRLAKEDESQEHGKQKKTDCVRFQMARSGVVDESQYCKHCNMFFTSPVVALSHYLGKVHIKKLKQVSGVQAHGPALHMQPVSAVERLSSENPSLPSPAEESSSSSNTRLELNISDKYCKLCCAPFNHPRVAQEHYTGKRHRRNEARKKILEELGDKALPGEYSTNAVGVGYYMCPVCKVTATSIETYLSHVQGSKHQINLCRERVLVSVRRLSKTTCVSIQDELTFQLDYIKVLATGQKPGRCLEKAGEFQDKNLEGRRAIGGVLSSNIKCEQGQHSSLLSDTQSHTTPGHNRSLKWASACEHALEETANCHCHRGCCKAEQGCEVAIIRDKSFSLSIAESEDCYKFVLAETSTNCFKTEQTFQVNHSEKTKHISEELKCHKEATKQKRRKNGEGADFGKENEKPKRIKLEMDLVNEENPRPYKGKGCKGKQAEKKQKALKG